MQRVMILNDGYDDGDDGDRDDDGETMMTMMWAENNCPAIYALGVEASTPSAPCAGPCMIGGFVKD